MCNIKQLIPYQPDDTWRQQHEAYHARTSLDNAGLLTVLLLLDELLLCNFSAFFRVDVA